ncbi:MAG TPA: ribosomal RNA small subunit methyltransferase A [Desulfurococcales archaeon]|nr:ribosomal RNA small subunit methyltransferase A [Desulfurococcales archaeon]
MTQEHCIRVSRRELLDYTLNILRKYNITPKKKLSQHFVVDPNIIWEFLKYSRPLHGRIVLEIGAGIGTITRYLALEAEKVIAVEIDKRLVNVLRNELSSYSNIEIVQQDILEYNPRRIDIIISNTPYHISTPLLFKLHEFTFEKAILMLQSDVVKRITAERGSPNYGRLTITVKMLYDVSVKKTYPPKSFYPPPEVESTMIVLKPKKLNSKSKLKYNILSELTRYLFSQRNKLTYKPLKKYLEEKGINSILQQLYSEKQHIMRKRVRDLDINDILEIVEYILPWLTGNLKS